MTPPGNTRPTTVGDLLCRFARELQRTFAHTTMSHAQPEDQLKAPIKSLIEDVGQQLEIDVLVHTETSISERGVRPDAAVLVNGLVVGHVELKPPGRGANPRLFTGHDRDQWKRLQDHPNLIYADGREWALYRQGELLGRRLRLRGDPTVEGAAAISTANAVEIEGLFRTFLDWQPIVPSSARQLAELLAPLCRLLREAAIESVHEQGSAISQLYAEWQQYLFPDADAPQFADAYAQTLTYAMLLARVEGEVDLHYRTAAQLEAKHGLLAQVLRLLTDPQARSEVDVPVSLLERVIGAVDPLRWTGRPRIDLPVSTFRHSRARAARAAQIEDPWLYFYEDFLAVYDPRLRRNRGVYFTPAQVVSAQVVLVTELLQEHFAKALGFVDDNVVVIDPACGTGTYLLAAVRSGLELVRTTYGGGAVAGRAATAARSFHGFELLVGPYAVSHLRFAQQVLANGGALPDDGVHVYLTDTLDSPNAEPTGQLHLTLAHRKLAEEHERARRVKADVRVLVCIGNPPYHRQEIRPDEEDVSREGGWVRYGDDGTGGILRDFVDPARAAGLGVHVKNLYNLYVYFWRWALWKVLDSTAGPGVVSFITCSSYLRGPGFVGMRRKLREVFDELWIIDLGGEGRGARRSDNVFAIQTPVAIAIGVRYGEPSSDSPAAVHYTRIDGSETEKLSSLAAIDGFDSLSFEQCFAGWEEPLLPESQGNFATWPLLKDLFPWQQSGVKVGRTWPIAAQTQLLTQRWQRLVSSALSVRPELFKNSPTGRRADRHAEELPPGRQHLSSIMEALALEPTPRITPYAFRSFDRQYLLADARLLDRAGPSLWLAHGPHQLYLTSLLTGILGDGPAAVTTDLIPDLHHFRGSFGGKSVVPLWRDAEATEPNVTAGLLDALSTTYGAAVTPEDLFSYCYGVLASPEYVGRFFEELEVPGPRIPLTMDHDSFTRVAALGRTLVRLHTFGQRFLAEGERANRIPKGRARSVREVPHGADRYPDDYSYDEGSMTLKVGSGEFAPISPEVFGFSVSGFPVVRSWLDYRMRSRHSQRVSSALDDIRVTTWPATFTEELLRVLWVIEHTLAVYPRLAAVLDDVIEGPTFKASDLPTPGEAQRRPPGRRTTVQASFADLLCETGAPPAAPADGG